MDLKKKHDVKYIMGTAWLKIGSASAKIPVSQQMKAAVTNIS